MCSASDRARRLRSHTSPFSSGHASMNSRVSLGILRSTADRSTTQSQRSHGPTTPPRRGAPPAVEKRTSFILPFLDLKDEQIFCKGVQVTPPVTRKAPASLPRRAGLAGYLRTPSGLSL